METEFIKQLAVLLAVCGLFGALICWLSNLSTKRRLAAEQKPAPIVFEVPKDKMLLLRQLSDEDDVSKGKGRVAHYRLWSTIVEIFPEVGTGSWHTEFRNALTMHIVQGPGSKVKA